MAHMASNQAAHDTKRTDYISWEDYFMGIAYLSGMRSKDPKTQVGACIVNKHNRIVGIGYNGMPDGCSDDKLSWGRPEKHLYVCHAEMNAILNKNSFDVRGCTIYVTLFPCNECAKLVIQSGISRVVYASDRPGKPEFEASRRLLKDANVEYKAFTPQNPKITIDFTAGDTA